MHCLGCGADLSNPKDRRALTNPEAADIVDLWRMFLESEDLREDVDVDQILRGQDRQRLPKICKKFEVCCLSDMLQISQKHPKQSQDSYGNFGDGQHYSALFSITSCQKAKAYDTVIPY